MKRSFAGIAFATVLLAATAPALAGETEPPAARVLRSWVAAFNGDRAGFERFVEASFDHESFGEMPRSTHLAVRDEDFAETHGIDLDPSIPVSPAGEHGAEALGVSRLTGLWYRVRVAVSPEPPHRIRGLQLQATLTPLDRRAPRGDLETVARAVEAHVDLLAEHDLFSGVVLLAKDGKPFFRKAWGSAHRGYGVPNRPDTRFNLGSLNKTFTAVAIARLVEQGRLSFDDPIGKHLPDYPGAEARQKVKIRHLLTHTSGVGDIFTEEFRCNRQGYSRVADYLPLFAGEPLAFEPGSRWRYSNGGFLVLGAILERVTGEDYFEHVRRVVLEPAGMTSTGFFELTGDEPNLATGYTRHWRGPGFPPDSERRSNVLVSVVRGSPAGGAYSNVDDLLRFDLALRGGKLLRPETFRTLASPHAEVRPGLPWGLGFSTTPDGLLPGHGGDAEGIGAHLRIDLKDGYTAIVLTNYDGARWRVMHKVDELLRLAESALTPK
jgi:CubicO group peptidase (beta-lactamase class C family)